ncbi:MAG: hypothetical protein WBG92_04535 [Thiohalocapsa sp.]
MPATAVKLTIRILLLTLLAALSGTASAAVYGFLEQAPMRYFSAEDNAMMTANIDAVLAAPDDNAPRTWRNDKTSNYGSAVALRTFTHQEINCRRLRIDNHAQVGDGRTTADLCEVEGVWKVLRLPE